MLRFSIRRDLLSVSITNITHVFLLFYATEKLRIWMLPTLAIIMKEVAADYVVGFDELGGTEDFSTETLAARLVMHLTGCF